MHYNIKNIVATNPKIPTALEAINEPSELAVVICAGVPAVPEAVALRVPLVGFDEGSPVLPLTHKEVLPLKAMSATVFH